MRTIWFGFFLIVCAIGAGFVLLGPDPMYHLFLEAGKKVAPQIFHEDAAPRPENTLVAPFAESGVSAAAAGKTAFLPVNATPLDQPHRTADEIATWLVTSVSNALTFTPSAYDKQQAGLVDSFTPEGLATYRSFMESSGFQTRVTANRQILSNYIQELPFLLNKGAVGGAYHWLFEVPLMVSFTPEAQRGNRAFNPQSEELLVNVDVIRVPGEAGDSVRIHNWSVKLKSLK